MHLLCRSMYFWYTFGNYVWSNRARTRNVFRFNSSKSENRWPHLSLQQSKIHRYQVDCMAGGLFCWIRVSKSSSSFVCSCGARCIILVVNYIFLICRKYRGFFACACIRLCRKKILFNLIFQTVITRHKIFKNWFMIKIFMGNSSKIFRSLLYGFVF